MEQLEMTFTDGGLIAPGRYLAIVKETRRCATWLRSEWLPAKAWRTETA